MSRPCRLGVLLALCLSLACACEPADDAPPGAAALDVDAGHTPTLADATSDTAPSPLDVSPPRDEGAAPPDAAPTDGGGDAGAVDTPAPDASVQDAVRPDATVPDAAAPDTATPSPGCEVVLEPAFVDFGTVPPGARRDMVLLLRNVGDRACGFDGATVTGCDETTPVGLPVCAPGTPNDHFAVVEAPAPSPAGLAPGATASLTVRFTPPDGEPAPGLAGTYAGFLQVTVVDPDAPEGEERSLVPPDPGPDTFGLASPNLLARTTDPPTLAALPDRLAFGAVTLGCFAGPRSVTIGAVGGAPVVVTAVGLDADCPSSFAVEAPPIPADGLAVTGAAPLVVAVRFAPVQVGEASCALVVRAEGAEPAELVVPLSGEGTLAHSVEDVFPLAGGRAVDVLFVIDDSGSMCETQDRLGAAIDAFLAAADDRAADLHVGVATTCVQEPDVCPGAGELRSDALPGDDRWVSTTTSGVLADAVSLGCSGGSDAQEAGLHAAWLALSAPYTRLTELACTDDGDCPDEGGALVCLADRGRCGGPNGGFLRDEAALSLVFVSDEDDQSPETPDFYAASFQAVKAASDPPQVALAHAIVGDRDAGCGDPNGMGPVAAAGDRYLDVVAATGGVAGSVCDPSYADTLSAIGERAFGPPSRFALSRAPDPATIAVLLDDTPCASGWHHDPTTNAVVLEDGGPCEPTAAATLTVTYDAACPAP